MDFLKLNQKDILSLNTDEILKEAFFKKPFITWKLIQM
jgi:hypothetical protein